MRLNLNKILTDTCDVLAASAATDPYGHPAHIPDISVVLATLACRLLPLGGGRGREFKEGKKVSISEYDVYVMPWTGADGTVLNEHLWLRINGRLFNILYVPPQLMAGAPLQISVELIKV